MEFDVNSALIIRCSEMLNDEKNVSNNVLLAFTELRAVSNTYIYDI